MPGCVLPKSSIKYAYHVLQYDRKQAINPRMARELGEVLDAQLAVWGTYERDGQQWRLSVEVLNVKGGRSPRQLTASSTNWSDAIYEIGLGVLREAGITPSSEEKVKLKRTLGSSQDAVELVSRAKEDFEKKRPLSETVAKLRSALALDPQYDPALEGLIHFLALQGKGEEALELAQRWVKEQPDKASALSSLADVYLYTEQFALAVEQIQKAIQLDPHQPDYYQALVQAMMQDGHWREAIPLLEKVITMIPYDPLPHAYLGESYVRQGNVSRTLTELKLAENFDDGSDAGLQQQLGSVYDALNNPVKAVACYESFLTSIDKYGVKVPVDNYRQRLASLKSCLTPHFVKATAPVDLTFEQIRSEAKDRLSPKQVAVITDPLELTTEMKNWVRETVGDTQDDLEKAKRLFIGLSRKVNISSPTQLPLSAKQAFLAWSDPMVALRCQDYALLYVTLARYAGLKAYYVYISKDYQDRPVLHACAGVFIGEQAVLVDPAYQWFGVPHKSYQFQDNQNLVAAWLAQSGDTTKEDAGLRLCQKWAAPFYIVVLNRVTRGEGKSATTYLYLQRGLKIDSEDSLSLPAQGSMDWSDQKWDDAIRKLSEGLETCPQLNHARYLLATALASQGKFPEAQAQFRTYLTNMPDPRVASNVRDWIKRMDELAVLGPYEQVIRSQSGKK